MEWRSSLKRSQSLKAVTCDKPVWTDAGLRDKRASVSQLVARYQVEVSQNIQTTNRIDTEEKSKEDTIQQKAWRPHLQASDLKDDVHTNKSETWTDDTWIQSKSQTSLSRSRSLGSLNTIDTLKSKFEGKSVAPVKQETFLSPPRKSGNIVSKVEKTKNTEDGQSIPAEAPVNKDTTEAKQTSLFEKVENNTKIQRRKTIGGIDFETLAKSQAEEKRRSIVDSRDISEKVGVSVKAISALYLSKVAPQEPKTLVPSSELAKRTRLTKFQPVSQEKCSACFKPVYSMERVPTDKYTFHKTCFCCKYCKKKLSMLNYASLHGELYCTYHYKQLFRTKGNYEDGFDSANTRAVGL